MKSNGFTLFRLLVDIGVLRKAALVFVALCLGFLVPVASRAANPVDYTVQLSVQTQESPPAITVNWVPRSAITGYTISRRTNAAGAWTQVATPSSSATSYVDTNVAIGTRYEYKVVGTAPDVTPYAYVYAGIDVPLVEDRGKLILLVDNTMATPLQIELDRLVQDLTGDGWTVLRHDVSRSASTSDIKAIIQTDYQADPANVKSVFIFGHLAMYFSANINPDGHAARPWPTDQYYGDMDYNWAASNTYYSAPSGIELQVGRVDLWNLPTFAPLTETDLLRRYLNKDHNYRTRVFSVQNKGVVADNFGEFGGEAFAQTGWRNFPVFVGASNVSAGAWGNNAPPYMLGYGCGGGTYTSASGVTDTASLRSNDPAVFTFLFGSYFGQYDAADCLLRAELATPNYGLTCGWSGRPQWFVHQMALGETIGYCTLRTTNNSYGPSGLQVDLMGDPSLRTFMVAPPTAFMVTVDDVGDVTLSWTASVDSVLGYYVYRSSQQAGPYTRITPNLIAGTSYFDTTAPVGQTYYMVRAVTLQTTASGTFYNASQGPIGSCTVPFVDIPTQGMMLWLKGSSGVAADSSGLVSSWADGSGNNSNLSQTNRSLSPMLVPNALDTRSVVRFQGGGQFLSAPGYVFGAGTAFTVIVQAKPASTSLSQVLCWQGGGTTYNGYGIYSSGGGRIKAGWAGPTSELISPVPSQSCKWYRIATSYDLLSHKMWVNGVLAGSSVFSGPSALTAGFTLGNYGPDLTQGWNGDIAEVLVYNRSLSDTNLASVETYLRGKYGKPSAAFVTTPAMGLAPLSVAFDASPSSDPDGSIASCVWDYGDFTGGTGTVTTHAYSNSGTYVIKLTVTDDDGFTNTTTSTVAVMPVVTAVSLAGDPPAPIGIGTAATLTATVTGGYLVRYKFMVNDGSGWSQLRDYAAGNTCNWTPDAVGTYQMQVFARSQDSPNSYDAASNVVSYVVAAIPAGGLRLWLRADSGLGRASGTSVTSWGDQSNGGNSCSQTFSSYMPNVVDNALNGKPVVHFSGSSCVLQSNGSVVAGATGFTSFTVARFASIPGSNYQYLWWNGGDTATTGYGVWLTTGSKLKAGWGSYNNAITYSGTATVGPWYRVASRYASGTHEMWVNGGFVGSTGKTGSNLESGFGVGNYAATAAYQGFYGDLAEILIYSRTLTESERLAVEQYLSDRWGPPAPVTTDRISVARGAAAGATVTITSPKVVTSQSSAFSDGSYYIEEPGRTSGVKIIGGTPSLWDNITLTGIMDRDANGEKLIRLQTTDSATAGTELRCLGMLNNAVTASGVLCRVWGKVGNRSSRSFTVDDGSGTTVPIDLSSLASPVTTDIENGFYVAVTGLAGLGSGGVSVVRPRGDADITVISN